MLTNPVSIASACSMTQKAQESLLEPFRDLPRRKNPGASVIRHYWPIHIRFGPGRHDRDGIVGKELCCRPGFDRTGDTHAFPYNPDHSNAARAGNDRSNPARLLLPLDCSHFWNGRTGTFWYVDGSGPQLSAAWSRTARSRQADRVKLRVSARCAICRASRSTK